MELAAVHVHGDGYAYYELGRLLWHYLHWWSVPVTGAVVTAVTWVRGRLGGNG